MLEVTTNLRPKPLHEKNMRKGYRNKQLFWNENAGFFIVLLSMLRNKRL